MNRISFSQIILVHIETRDLGFIRKALITWPLFQKRFAGVPHLHSAAFVKYESEFEIQFSVSAHRLMILKCNPFLYPDVLSLPFK